MLRLPACFTHTHTTLCYIQLFHPWVEGYQLTKAYRSGDFTGKQTQRVHKSIQHCLNIYWFHLVKCHISTFSSCIGLYGLIACPMFPIFTISAAEVSLRLVWLMVVIFYFGINVIFTKIAGFVFSVIGPTLFRQVSSAEKNKLL